MGDPRRARLAGRPARAARLPAPNPRADACAARDGVGRRRGGVRAHGLGQDARLPAPTPRRPLRRSPLRGPLRLPRVRARPPRSPARSPAATPRLSIRAACRLPTGVACRWACPRAATEGWRATRSDHRRWSGPPAALLSTCPFAPCAVGRSFLDGGRPASGGYAKRAARRRSLAGSADDGESSLEAMRVPTPAILIVVPTRELGVQVSMIAYRLLGGRCPSARSDDPPPRRTPPARPPSSSSSSSLPPLLPRRLLSRLLRLRLRLLLPPPLPPPPLSPAAAAAS